ncbi:hypothetical protein WJX84_007229 [Apatococcus fuscideae]|uniref:Uncharacterized protein n=1 Tax=Apatococcus fuscideae TaxID=2026836 RepID=A0AAW1T846_9CHLO
MLAIQSLDRRDCCLKIPEGSERYLGRGNGSGIDDSTVSSKHATVSAVRATDGSLVLQVAAKDTMRIKLPGKNSAAKLLSGSSVQVKPGAQLFLRAHGKYGFAVEEQASPALRESELSSDPQVSSPLQKRRRLVPCTSEADHLNPSNSPAKPTAASQEEPEQMQPEPGPSVPPVHRNMAGDAPAPAGTTHHTTHAVSPLSRTLPERASMEGAQEVTSQDLLFEGVHTVFWERSHMRLLMDRVKQAGAVLQNAIDSNTSLVISPKILSPEDAVNKLQAVPDANDTIPFTYHNRPLRFPTGIDFVEKEFLVQCLARNTRLPPAPFRIHLQLLALHATPNDDSCDNPQDALGGQPSGDAAGVTRASSQQDKAETEILELAAPSSPAAKTSQVAAPPKTPDNGISGGATSTRGMIAQGVQMLKEVASPKPGPKAPIQESPKKTPGPEPASHEPSDGRPRFTGGSSGITWGSHGVWEEPWTHATAVETLQLLDANWHGLKAPRRRLKSARVPHAQAVVPSATQGASQLVSESDEEEEACLQTRSHTDSSEDMAPHINEVCLHQACAAQSSCIVAELETIRDNYTKGRDQFQIKAMDRTIQAVRNLETSLARPADADELDVGGKSRDKLKEIITTGSFRRNQNQAQDEHRKTVQLFSQVWGVAETSSERFYREGCRTLDDLRQRSDLTDTQVVGLKYHEDLQHRIPRSEVQMAEDAIRQAVMEVLPSRRIDDASDPLYAYCMGSYLRGKPATGDIDFMLVPPASMGKLPCGPLLQRLLKQLLQVGLLVDELEPTRLRVPAEHEGSASWMGIARPAGSPHFRRIDIKVYPRRALPFVINHFTGSRDFNRALRRQRQHGRSSSPARKRPRLQETSDDEMAIANGHAGPNQCNGSHHDASDSEQAVGDLEVWLGSPGQPRINRAEYIRIIQQALHGLGFKDVAQQLERSSGVQYQAREVTHFRDAIVQGDWDEAVRLLGRLKLSNSESFSKAKFLLLEQKYLEAIQARELTTAVKCLRSELAPLKLEPERLHQLAACILATNTAALAAAASWPGPEGGSREQLLADLQEVVAPEVMLPERRLEVLLEQALQSQLASCPFHNAQPAAVSLLHDYQCGREQIPTCTTQVLLEHTDEVIMSLAWSPDDSQIATCSSDKSVRVWTVADGVCRQTFTQHIKGVSSVAWMPDSVRLLSGSTDKYIYMFDTQTGTKLQAWKGHVVHDLVVSHDGRYLISTTSERKVRVFDMEEEEEKAAWSIVEGDSISSLALTQDSRFLLVNLIKQQIHLWPLAATPHGRAPNEPLQVYEGLQERRGRFVVRPCFGGYNEAFVLSGSEECKVYVWHRSTGELLASLEGHSGTVNAVSWNPVDHQMFASASDDRSIHIWGLQSDLDPEPSSAL